ncbi:restriction endonuclease subunit S [Fusobacterium sp. MFO224]|uniref:restriction endonuclease subunit S n=1 Tax=Fusobacterium sp. MFO224 TaxID=3378070 RepID=UPI003852620F
MINKNIKTIKDFQTSVNILYDLENEEKIKKFIGTTSSIEIIEEIFLSILTTSTSKARILVGAYGRGKSHLVLVILSLLYKKNVKIFEKLLYKIEKMKPELYKAILDYLKSEQKILPVVIGGSATNLRQSFLIGLNQALEKEKLEKVMPKTNFTAVISTIQNWKLNYKETYDKFIEKIDSSIEEFIFQLEEFNIETYENFKSIYPTLTSGSEFNPFLKSDIVEIYTEVSKQVKSYGYSGLYIVYDEFSKYLESSISNTSNSDIKLLQDFAEKCERSGKNQMHLMLISHKDIGNYIDDKLSKEKVDAWKGVSGRFAHMIIQNHFIQMYEIISNVIYKDKNYWKNFKEKNENKFIDLKETYLKNKLIINDEELDLVIEDCYPLHPISTFILPRLSEKIAQNERTMFTFLSSEQKYTLNNFLNKLGDKYKLLTPDYLFDYFDPLIKKEIYTGNIYKTYRLLKNVLEKTKENKLETKILKTLFLIYIIEEFERVAPTQETIINIYKYSVKNISEIENALESLKEKECVVFLKRSNNYLKIKESSGKNIKEEILKCQNKRTFNLDYIDLINNLSFEKYLYPNRYNDEKEIIRYFKYEFISEKEFFCTRNWEKRAKDSKADGLLIGIISNSRESTERIKKEIFSKNINSKRVLFILSKEYKEISDLVFEYEALKDLIEDNKEDIVLKEEYEIFLEDVEEVVFRFIYNYLNPELNKNEYFYNSKKVNIHRKAQLSNLISDICEVLFPLTPIINNETINKNKLPGVTIKNRNKVISKLLENNLQFKLGLKGNGQDVFIARTLLYNLGILQDNETKTIFDLKNIKDKNIEKVLNVIDGYLKKSSYEKPESFLGLYEILTLPKYQIGLKKGLIPVYISVMLHQYRENIIITDGKKELKITAELLSAINDDPSKYNIYIEKWDEKKEYYLKGLEKIFEEFINETEKNYNSFLYLGLAMRRWLISIPKYSKETKKEYESKDLEGKSISRINVEFLRNLKDIESKTRESLFEDFLRIYNYKELDLKILKDIENTKNYYDYFLLNLKNKLILDLKHIFSEKYNDRASLTSVIKDWKEILKEETKNNIFSKNRSEILELMINIDNNEILFLEKLAKLTTSLRIEDWNEKIIKEFIQEIYNFKEEIEEFNSKDQTEKEIIESGYEISFLSEEGKKITKSLKKVEYGVRSKLLYNDLVNSIDEMGESITKEEKRQVLIDILTKL